MPFVVELEVALDPTTDRLRSLLSPDRFPLAALKCNVLLPCVAVACLGLVETREEVFGRAMERRGLEGWLFVLQHL